MDNNGEILIYLFIFFANLLSLTSLGNNFVIGGEDDESLTKIKLTISSECSEE